MSQSGQRTALSSFTIAVDRAGTDTSSKMTLQHIVKPIAAEKMSDAILVTDFEINKSFRTEPLRHLLNKIPPLIIGDAVSELDKIPPLTLGDAVSDTYPLSERNTLDSERTIDIEQKNLLAVESPPRAVKGWRWALVVSTTLSFLFLFALDNTIVADIQPAIAETFEDVGKLPWLGVAFLLGAASTNLVSIFL
jgi:hypothetical protein